MSIKNDTGRENVEYLAMLDTSIAEAEKGEVVVKSIEELETYE